MKPYESVLDALGEGTRRHILELLRDRPRSVGELATGLPESRPAVSQHLRVLREAGLVTSFEDGARNVYRIEPRALGEVRAYFERFWRDAVEAFKQQAERKGGTG